MGLLWTGFPGGCNTGRETSQLSAPADLRPCLTALRLLSPCYTLFAGLQCDTVVVSVAKHLPTMLAAK